jgi:3',5'-cyclic-AMP phosphodiesterase
MGRSWAAVDHERRRPALIPHRQACRGAHECICDSHIGFNKAPNPDAALTFKALLDRLSALNPRPALMLHTGDVSHLARDAEWDTAQQLVNETGIETHFIPGEHDMLVDGGKPFFARFARQALPRGWYSFDQHGVHFVALLMLPD